MYFQNICSCVAWLPCWLHCRRSSDNVVMELYQDQFSFLSSWQPAGLLQWLHCSSSLQVGQLSAVERATRWVLCLQARSAWPPPTTPPRRGRASGGPPSAPPTAAPTSPPRSVSKYCRSCFKMIGKHISSLVCYAVFFCRTAGSSNLCEREYATLTTI